MMRRGRAAVVVLGDIGRSPRMQYHALSLARQASLEVDIVAYEGTNPHNAVMENPTIHLHKMTPIILKGFPRILNLLLLPLKTVIQFFMLLWYLFFKIPPPDVFIVQNPPSVPTLVAVKWASWWRRSMFVIDWHNFGYTLLGMSLGRSHFLVKVYRWQCNTNWLKIGISKQQFCMISLLSSFILLHSRRNMRLENDLSQPHGIRDCVSHGNVGYQTAELVSGAVGVVNSAAIHVEVPYSINSLFTTQVGDDIFLKPNRPAIIVSSTSWTADEDFGMLLEAAVFYDRRVAAVLNEDDSTEEERLWADISNGRKYIYPRLPFIITGKGPQREQYEEKIKNLNLKRVAFRTMWLSAEDYPLLLGSADLGVCLHTSSSGLDLPMKIVDMFGCGLPVCAVSYSCIEELVKVEKNGLLFSSSSELADELMMLFKGFPDDCGALNSLRTGVLATGSSAKWATEWEEHAMPLIAEASFWFSLE